MNKSCSSIWQSMAVTLAATLLSTGCQQSPSHSASAGTSATEAETSQSVEVRPRVSGYIDRVAFQEGARVKKGQILFRIDPRPFRAETERQYLARQRALSALELAKADRARAQRVGGQNAMSRAEFDRLSSADRAAAGDFAAATAALSAAKLNLELTEVRAPVDGRVSRALLTQGNLVSSDSLMTTVVPDAALRASFAADQRTF